MGAAARRALVAVLACLLAGCTVGPSQRPPVVVQGTNLPAAPAGPTAVAPDELPQPQDQRPRLTFTDCTADALAGLRSPAPPGRDLHVECATLAVPADPDRPAAGEIRLGLLRAGPAGAPLTRPPLLALGDSAGEPSARHALTLATRVDPALLERFTLVGLDRRGAGREPLDCAPQQARSAITDADPDTTTDQALGTLLEQARTVVQECNLATDRDLGDYRTPMAAHDIVMLRGALGVDRLSAVGVGDGAAVLAGWAALEPHGVGRLVLDGPPDPVKDDPDLAESRAAAAEAAFSAFAVACTAGPGCPIGPDPRAAVLRLVQALRERPLPAPDGRRLTAGGALTALQAGLGEPGGWPALAAALGTAAGGDPAPLLGLLDPVLGPGGTFDVTLATGCNDARRRLSPGEVGTLAGRWRTAYPLFGAPLALRLLACAPWPAGGPRPAASSGNGAPPILVIGTAADPRAPLDGSRRASEALASARFLSWQGAGTGAYPRTACVRGVVDAMLVDGVAPQAATLCPP